jgi:hypothetical protein
MESRALVLAFLQIQDDRASRESLDHRANLETYG